MSPFFTFYPRTSALVLTHMSDVGLNIGAHQEAIEHFLSALAMQESSGGGKSEQLWTTLRRAFQQMVSTFGGFVIFALLLTL